MCLFFLYSVKFFEICVLDVMIFGGFSVIDMGIRNDIWYFEFLEIKEYLCLLLVYFIGRLLRFTFNKFC